ncbi:MULTISPECIES: ferredoxin reductase [unclassified Acinetobacter]|uniref:ferredoxin reductase n=1 Tax=unclassified Acinetobacter TaxID=196816 RepID=UPI0029344B59|nr:MULTISPECIES: ferredoxin reductase [unclassified Acinetobacter]WOE32018.1 ferredoxin reductase [Acinetobacter sp. SAAs470]WOE37486.1 ferredoxin reductase [Acinetobacter sp. SAAs474]
MHVIEKSKFPITSLVDAVIGINPTNFWLKKINPLWSINQALGKIIKKEVIANDTVSLTLRCNRHFRTGQAGQHHPVFVNIHGIRYERTYSLTSLDDQTVLLTVKKVDQGKVSSWLVEQAQVGDLLEFGQPYGDMLLPDQKSLLLLAAGSGITPMYSLIHAMFKSAVIHQTPVHLMYWVKKNQDSAFKAQFEAWAQQNSNFTFQCFFTQEQDPDARLNEMHLDDLAEIEQRAVYACGPSGFTTQVEKLFHHADIIKTEAFSMTPILNDDVGFVNITLTQSNKVLAIPKGQSILLGLEQHDIKPKHGCRMGICNKCACNKQEGSTKNLVNGMQNNEPGNFLKICVNSAQTDLTIDL